MSWAIAVSYTHLDVYKRQALGGAQEYYQTKCDLSIFGKAFANGYILAAVAGKKEVLDICAPGGKTNFIGTFNGHQVSLCAAAATFDMIEDCLLYTSRCV